MSRSSGPDGERRTIAVDDFFRLPHDTPHVENELAAGRPDHGGHPARTAARGEQRYRKVRDRASYAFALVSVAAVVEVADGKIASATLSFGGLAHCPGATSGWKSIWSARRRSRALFAEAADLLLRDAEGQGHNDFKIPLTKRTLVASLSDVCGVGDDA